MLKLWHSLYELVKLPLEMVFIGVICLEIGNLITNSVFSTFYTISNTYVLNFGSLLTRVGTYIVVNFPVLVLLRLVMRKNGSHTTVLAAFAGYGAFLASTMVFHQDSLPSTAYSSILGMSLSAITKYSSATTTYYPIQTGLIGVGIVVVVTLAVYSRLKERSHYGIFSFVSKSSSIVITTMFFCALLGIGVSYLWPYFYLCIRKIVSFISMDTTNPINLALYGITERVLGMLNLGTLIRTPFWYSSNGGSWVNVSGSSITGDVSIWTGQVAVGSLTNMAGRFITPYYILNIFAIPGLILAVYSLQTNKLERRKSRMLFVIAIICSLFCGTLLPLELTMLVVCPLLLFMHLGCTGILYAVLQGLHIYLGYSSSSTLTMTALPGTLLEALVYFRNGTVGTSTYLKLIIIGVIMFIVYFAMTRLYFKYLAIDIFQTGGNERAVTGVLKSVGGVENIRLINSNFDTLTISLYDSTRLDVDRLKRLGAVRILDTPGGYAISLGAGSTMVRMGIQQRMRDTNRNDS